MITSAVCSVRTMPGARSVVRANVDGWLIRDLIPLSVSSDAGSEAGARPGEYVNASRGSTTSQRVIILAGTQQKRHAAGEPASRRLMTSSLTQDGLDPFDDPGQWCPSARRALLTRLVGQDGMWASQAIAGPLAWSQ